MKRTKIKWVISFGLLSLLFTGIGGIIGEWHHVAAKDPHGTARAVMVVLGWPSMLSYFPECGTRNYLRTVYDHHGHSYQDRNLFHFARITILNGIGWGLVGLWIGMKRTQQKDAQPKPDGDGKPAP